jgi:hypothetical protein
MGEIKCRGLAVLGIMAGYGKGCKKKIENFFSQRGQRECREKFMDLVGEEFIRERR